MYWYTETLMMMFLSILGTVPEWGSDSLGVLLTTRATEQEDRGSALGNSPRPVTQRNRATHLSSISLVVGGVHEGFKYENL